MATLEKRLKHLEEEINFRAWIRIQRILEDASVDELSKITARRGFPDRPEPVPGASRLDTLDRKTLLKTWSRETPLPWMRASDEGAVESCLLQMEE
jgi:hypothetical protein